jgi:cation transport ATPase
MYTFSKRLKIVSILLFVVGAVGWGTSYVASHDLTLDDVKTLLAEEHSYHGAETSHSEEAYGADAQRDVQTNSEAHAAMIHSTHDSNTHAEESHVVDTHNDDAHAEHVLHQMHNRPYAALYVAAFFFFMISLGVLAFYAIQYAAQAGWSPVLFRVMEAITYYLLPGALIVLGIAWWAGDHIFIWMDPEVVAHDELIQAKSGWLNKTWFMIRGLIFITGWSLYRYFSRKFSLAQDLADVNDNKNFKNNLEYQQDSLCFIFTRSL